MPVTVWAEKIYTDLSLHDIFCPTVDLRFCAVNVADEAAQR